MKLNLLRILSEEIKEQGFGRYYADITLPSGKKAGDIEGFDFEKMTTIDKKEIPFEKDKNSSSSYSNVESLNVDLFDSKNIIKPEFVARGSYGWRGPIMSLCASVKTGNKGPRYCDYHWHDGEDYSLATGHQIVTLVPGTVEAASTSGESVLEIRYSDGSKGRYIHCDTILVKKGDNVYPGQVVATVGNRGHSTGPHLHYEYYPSSGGEKTMSRASNKGGTITKQVKTTDPKALDEKIFLFVKKGKESDFQNDLSRVLGKSKNEIKVIEKEDDIYSSLPSNVKKAIDSLYSKWGVKITNKHLEKEIAQEGEYVPDAGRESEEAKEQINNLISDCKKQFPNVVFPANIISSYRSYNDQIDNFGYKVKTQKRSIEDVQSYNTIPGFSQHHTGKAFDIFSTEPSWWDANSDVKKWVSNNCGDYGFEVTYKEDGILRKKEPWHLFYVGVFSEDENEINVK